MLVFTTAARLSCFERSRWVIDPTGRKRSRLNKRFCDLYIVNLKAHAVVHLAKLACHASCIHWCHPRYLPARSLITLAPLGHLLQFMQLASTLFLCGVL